jgi:S-(hydroxymethyl)glutathione dehydrogenase/alcohol dehydrogenase
VTRTAIDLLDWGGTCVILGVPGFTEEASFNVLSMLYVDRTIMGCRYGSARPQHDFPLLADLYLAGRLKLDELVTRTYKLEEINEGYADMNAGRNIRGMVLYDESDY